MSTLVVLDKVFNPKDIITQTETNKPFYNLHDLFDLCARTSMAKT